MKQPKKMIIKFNKIKKSNRFPKIILLKKKFPRKNFHQINLLKIKIQIIIIKINNKKNIKKIHLLLIILQFKLTLFLHRKLNNWREFHQIKRYHKRQLHKKFNKSNRFPRMILFKTINTNNIMSKKIKYLQYSQHKSWTALLYYSLKQTSKTAKSYK